MTTKPAALSAQSTSSPFGSTLHDVRKHLVIRTDLTPQRRRNLLSAINKLCQILDRADHQIPTAMNLLRPLLHNASPGAFLVNPRHWGNIRSSVFAGIKLSGLGGDFNAKVVPITDAWPGSSTGLPATSRSASCAGFAASVLPGRSRRPLSTTA